MTPRVRINIAKSADKIVTQNKDFMKMKDSLGSICEKLALNNEKFQKEEVIEDLARYIKAHDRILYSEISNRIYAYYNEYGPLVASEIIGQMINNIEALIDYTKDYEYKVKFNSNRDYRPIGKVLVKIWDHVNLAVQQYTMLRMSDD